MHSDVHGEMCARVGKGSRPLNHTMVSQLLTRALEGGGEMPTLRFFADSRKTAARSAAIF